MDPSLSSQLDHDISQLQCWKVDQLHIVVDDEDGTEKLVAL
jgi:hypothetical protein